MKTPVILTLSLLFILALAACGGVIAPPAMDNAATATPAASPAATATPAATTVLPRLEDRDCDLFVPRGEVLGETIQCGYVVVPALRDKPDGKTVKLSYVILKATGDNPAPDPIIHIAGGPGIASTVRSSVLELGRRYAPMRKDRDIILYDQRGMGHSLPFLDCSQFVQEAGNGQINEEGATNVLACQQAMDALGYPTEAFSTPVSAADLMDLMQALGYPEYNLYGISYGSRLAMSLLHYFPEDAPLHAVILDSVETLPEDVGNEFRPPFHLMQQAMFEDVFATCQADADCAAAYPDLRAQFDALVQQLDQQPIQLDEDTVVDGDAIYRYAYPYHAGIQNIPYQPRMIMELRQGITTTLSLIANGEIPEPATRTLAVASLPNDEVSAFLDLLLDCEFPEETDGGPDPLIGYWDADAERLSALFQQSCPQDVAAQAIASIQKTPQLFNHYIMRYVSEAVQGLNKDINWKFLCTESAPFGVPLDQLQSALKQARLPAFYIEEAVERLKDQQDGCDAWRDRMTKPTPAEFGKYPVLVLAGQFDSITPPAWGGHAAAILPNAQLVHIPNAFHGVMGNNGPCPTDIVQGFLAAPGEPVDASCTEGMTVQFLPPETSDQN